MVLGQTRSAPERQFVQGSQGHQRTRHRGPALRLQRVAAVASLRTRRSALSAINPFLRPARLCLLDSSDSLSLRQQFTLISFSRASLGDTRKDHERVNLLAIRAIPFENVFNSNCAKQFKDDSLRRGFNSNCARLATGLPLLWSL